ncbi:MAG: tetratricopeptide repeat protein [Tepidanaerobacteraceae bacterium]
MVELLNKAEGFMEKGNYTEAKKIYYDILSKDPNQALAFSKLGVIFARENEKDKAEAYFNKALKLNPKLSSAASNLGNLYFEKGDFNKAKEFYEKAIAMAPDNSIPYNNLAVVYKKLNDLDKYVEFYKKSIHLTTWGTNTAYNPIKGGSKGKYTVVFGGLAIILLAIYLLSSYKG